MEKKKKKQKQEEIEQEEDSTVFTSVTSKNGQVFIQVSAKPGSKIDAITAVEPDFIGVSVQAPPRDGEANEGIREFLATILGVKKCDVEVVKGEKSHDKVLMVEASCALKPSDVIQKLKDYMDS